MAVPGIRRVRSRSIRGAAEISAQFDPSTDMVVALQKVQNRVAEITGDLPADTELQIERMTPAIFPVFILSLTGALPTADLYDYANFVVKPELARVPGAGLIEVQASDTREIEVVLDPAKLTAAELTVVDVSDALKTQNTVLPVGRFQESGLQHLTLASGLWKSIDQIAQAPVMVKNGATIRVSDLGTVTRGAPDRTLLVTGNGRDAVVDEHLAADRRQHPRSEGRSRRRAGQPHARPAGRHHDHPGLRPGRVRRGLDRQRPRRHPHRRLPRDRRAARVPARLAADARSPR